MARIADGQWILQKLGDDVVLFNEHTDEEIVRYPMNDPSATAQAQKTIHDSKLTAEEKCFVHFWSGYFYAHSGM